MMMIRIGSFRGSSRRWLQRDHVKGILKRICTRMVTTTSGNECPEYIYCFVWRTMNPILTRTTSTSSSTSRTVDVMVMVIGWIPWYGGSDGRCILLWWQSGGVLFRDGFRMQHAH